MRDLSNKFYSGVKIIRLSIQSLRNVRLAGSFKLLHVLSSSFLLFTQKKKKGHSSSPNRESLKNLENNLLKKRKRKSKKLKKQNCFCSPQSNQPNKTRNEASKFIEKNNNK